MQIQVHKICNGCGANIEQSFAYKIKSYLIKILINFDFKNSDGFSKFSHFNFLIKQHKKFVFAYTSK